jgi:hypothetical protein
MLSLIIGCKNLRDLGVNQRKGKLRVIGGRKAVRPNWIGRLPKDGGFLISGAFAWDFFYKFFKVPGMNMEVPGIKGIKGNETSRKSLRDNLLRFSQWVIFILSYTPRKSLRDNLLRFSQWVIYILSYTLKNMRLGNAKMAKSIFTGCLVLCDGNGNL